MEIDIRIHLKSPSEAQWLYCRPPENAHIRRCMLGIPYRADALPVDLI